MCLQSPHRVYFTVAYAKLTEQLFPARAISAHNRDSIPLRISFCPITSEICTCRVRQESIELVDRRCNFIWPSKRHLEMSLRAQRRSKMRRLLIRSLWRLPSPFGCFRPSAVWSIVWSLDRRVKAEALISPRPACALPPEGGWKILKWSGREIRNTVPKAGLVEE